MGVPRVLGHAGENDIGQLPPPVMGGSPLSQDGGKQTCAGTASHPVSQEASEPDQTVLHKLARRTLWIAYCWNDHNFEAAHKEARRTAEECGINSFDDANDWLKKLPKAPSTEKVSQEPDPHDDSALREICNAIIEETLDTIGWAAQVKNNEIIDRVLGEVK